MGAMLRRKLGRILLWCSGATAVLIVGVAVWWVIPPPAIAAWRSGPPREAWAALERQELRWRQEGLDRRPEHTYRALDQISPNLPLAILVNEDISYFDHGAVDLVAIGEALDGWLHGQRLRGASTLTQQLAKVLFLSPERTLQRKLAEARLAWWLDRRLGKRRVLELYLNVVEFGPGLFGAEAAARRYYGVGAADLGAEQAAGLAACVPSPGIDNPATATRRWRARRDLIVARMHHAAWLEQRIRSVQGSAGTGLANAAGRD